VAVIPSKPQLRGFDNNIRDAKTLSIEIEI